MKITNTAAMQAATKLKRISLDIRDFSEMVLPNRFDTERGGSPVRSTTRSMMNTRPGGGVAARFPSTTRAHEPNAVPSPVTNRATRDMKLKRRGSTSLGFSSGASAQPLLSNIVVNGKTTNLFDDLMIARFPKNQDQKPGKLGTRYDIRPILKGAFSRV